MTKVKQTRTRRPKKPPFAPVKQLSENKWWCTYGMHGFPWFNRYAPIDCPDRHAFRATLTEEMADDRELREYFESLNTNIDDLSLKQIVELIKRIKPPQEVE